MSTALCFFYGRNRAGILKMIFQKFSIEYITYILTLDEGEHRWELCEENNNLVFPDTKWKRCI